MKASFKAAIVFAAALFYLAWVSAASAQTMGGNPSGVGGDPPSGPFPLENDMWMVGPVTITIDPNAPPWIKEFAIPADADIPVGKMYSVWEDIIIQPPQPGTTTPHLPLTDWHEHIDSVDFDLPFKWAGGEIHLPNPDGTAPIIVPGGVSDDGQSIWFGPFPPVPILPPGAVISIHKQLMYAGSGPITPSPGTEPPTIIRVREWPTTPEPTTLVLAGLGCVAAVGLRRRRQTN